jgi:16S rRNA (adenine1518-N6/adenine1519-N6)-dimethyltransferase
MTDPLPPLRDVIAATGIVARKSLGQNFLLDLNLTSKIARLAGPLQETDVLEVGPGPGGLTRGLLSEGARHVVAIERDPRFLPALQAIAATYPGRLTLIEGDALVTDVEPHLTAPVQIISNLPYNVGTELLVRWLSAANWPPFWRKMTLMFQKEVAERIIARPGTRAYGRLSLLAQWRTEPRIVLEVPPQAFVPPPKVTSAVVHFERLDTPRYPADPQILNRIVALAFGQRRKMLRSSLRSLAPDVVQLLDAAGIRQTDRAEQIPLEAYCRLSRILASTTNRPPSS